MLNFLKTVLSTLVCRLYFFARMFFVCVLWYTFYITISERYIGEPNPNLIQAMGGRVLSFTRLPQVLDPNTLLPHPCRQNTLHSSFYSSEYSSFVRHNTNHHCFHDNNLLSRANTFDSAFLLFENSISLIRAFVSWEKKLEIFNYNRKSYPDFEVFQF